MRNLSQPPASAPATTLSHPIRLSDILSPRTPLTGISAFTADEHHPVEVEVEIVDDPPMSGWSDSTLSTPAPTPLSSAFRPISRLSGRTSLERGPEARATARRDADADADADALGDASHYGDVPSAPVKLRLELPPAVKFRTRLSRLASSPPLDGVLDIGRTPPNTASAGEGRELSMGETRASRTSFSISSWARARSRPSIDLRDSPSISHPSQEVSPGSATNKSPLKWLRRVSGSPAPPSSTTRGFWGLPSPLQRIRTPRTASKEAQQVKRTWTIQLDKAHGQIILSPHADSGTAGLKSPRPLPTPISADHDGANAASGEGTGPADMSPMSPLPPLRTPKTPSSASTHSVSRPGEGTYRVSVETASSAGVVLLMRDESGALLARLSLGQDGDRVELLSPEEGQQHSDEPEGGIRNKHEHESSADAPTQQIPLETLNGSGGDSLRLYAPGGTYTWRTTPGLALCHSPSRTTTAKISWRPLGRTRLTVIGYEDDQPMTHLLLVSAAKVWLDRQADRDFRL